MKLSPAGRAALILREGKRNQAYKDSVGVWTIGVGHTAAAGPPAPKKGMVISDAQIDALLAKDIVQYENAVNAACGPALNQNQFDAMVSLCFNIGVGGFKKSTVVKRWNAGDVQGAAKAFMMWLKPPELKGRRESEVKQFLTPVKEAIKKPTQPVSEPEAVAVPDKPANPAGGAVVGTGGAIVAGGAAAKAAGFDWSVVLAGGVGIAIAALIIFLIIQKRKSL